MLRVILADDEQYERNYLEKVIKESYPGLLEISPLQNRQSSWG